MPVGARGVISEGSLYLFPVVMLLSSDASMPFPGAQMNAAVRFSSSAYGLVRSNAEVMVIGTGAQKLETRRERRLSCGD